MRFPAARLLGVVALVLGLLLGACSGGDTDGMGTAPRPLAMDVLPDGRYVVLGTQEIALHDFGTQTGAVRFLRSPSTYSPHLRGPLVLSSEGEVAAAWAEAAFGRYDVAVWDLASRQPIALVEVPEGFRLVDAGRDAIAGVHDQDWVVIDTESGTVSDRTALGADSQLFADPGRSVDRDGELLVLDDSGDFLWYSDDSSTPTRLESTHPTPPQAIVDWVAIDGETVVIVTGDEYTGIGGGSSPRAALGGMEADRSVHVFERRDGGWSTRWTDNGSIRALAPSADGRVAAATFRFEISPETGAIVDRARLRLFTVDELLDTLADEEFVATT